MLAIANWGVVHHYNACYPVYPLLEAAQEELILPGSMALKGRTVRQKSGHVAQCLFCQIVLAATYSCSYACY